MLETIFALCWLLAAVPLLRAWQLSYGWYLQIWGFWAWLGKPYPVTVSDRLCPLLPKWCCYYDTTRWPFWILHYLTAGHVPYPQPHYVLSVPMLLLTLVSGIIMFVCCVVLILHVLFGARSPVVAIKNYIAFVVRAMLRHVFTHLVDWARHEPNMPTHQLRAEFRSTPVPRITRSSGHTHPESAAWRSSATTILRSFASRLGFGTYVLQKSSIDVKRGFSGGRTYWWFKDVSVPADYAEPGSNDVIALVDVDYYVDMPMFLVQYEHPVMLYTFQPKVPACASGEYSFTFTDNTVHYSVSGGASYEHLVWDYGVDVLYVSTGLTTRAYVVERKPADQHHEYVLLVPIGSWYGVWALFVNMLSGSTLRRLSPTFGAFNVMDEQTMTGRRRHVSKAGAYNVATVDMQTFDALSSVVATASLKVGFATVQSWVPDRHSASVLLEYFRVGQAVQPPLVYAPADGVLKYQVVPDLREFEPDCDALMVAYMSPVVPMTYVPDKSANNEKAAVAGRIVNPALDAKAMTNGPPSAYLLQLIDEFVGLLIPTPHEGVPVEVEEVFVRQDRPSQRALLNNADASLPHRTAVTFLKQEPYQKTSDPRIITTYDAVDKREYGRYIYALSDFVQKQPWYAFGKTPVEIATIVATICSACVTGVSASDLEKMDGHVSQLARDVERAVLLRYFQRKYHVDIVDRHNGQFNLRARTKSGFKYDLGVARGSGSQETSLFNTLLSKLIDYIKRRNADIPPVEAFQALGIFGGDDGLAAEIRPGLIGGEGDKKAAAMIGQRLTVDEYLLGESGVNFLSRFYSDRVWQGDNASTCDLARMLGKLHVTPRIDGFTPVQKLAQKLMGLELSDQHTPVVAQILAAARRVGMEYAPFDHRLASWWAQYKDDNWPNRPVDDEHAYVTSALPDVDVTKLYAYLDEVKEPTDLLVMPCIVEQKVPVVVPKQAVINDVVVPAVAPQVVGCCKDYVARKCHDPCPRFLRHVKICGDFVKGKCDRSNCKYEHVTPQ